MGIKGIRDERVKQGSRKNGRERGCEKILTVNNNPTRETSQNI
jgi:hypothetical protein